MLKITTCILLTLLFFTASSQVTPAKIDTLRKDALNVFMEASDYVRKEIPYVNYVRDIKDAGVYIISTYQNTGSGGSKRTYFLVGQLENTGMKDTISFVTSPDEKEDEIRVKEVRTLKMGLMRYVAKTPLSKYMKISFSEPLSETVSSDKWNSWVYRASFNGWFDGQQTYKSTNLNGNISASRVTADWKINLSGRYNYGIEKFIVSDETINSNNNSKSLNSLVVRSISDHWSYGGSIYLGSSSYSNTIFSGSFLPGIEYDLYPYSQSTRKQLRLLYSLGYKYTNYLDTTIYNMTKEGHLMHSFNAAYAVVQKWGSINLSMNYSNYMHDWSKNNLSLNGWLDLRISKGLSVNFGGGASLIHDQLGLVKGGATTEEVLLRRKELATQFQYFTSFGFTYTFGSIYNNVVNPRFGNSGGGGMTIMMSY
ncbi:MAG: hypothetical protein NTZ69_08425 [Bacteroidia bacterium]|nr:hypothetical protein [Bacteroidia bacterium]